MNFATRKIKLMSLRRKIIKVSWANVILHFSYQSDSPEGTGSESLGTHSLIVKNQSIVIGCVLTYG